ncbi:hypothetical protein D3874_11945 [Oleomonas cavernae]|uniref:Uncharacterized protein n=1 Tax=Oleomonas cavernae TaxID=2320859 RepID=A0A418WCC3_9PROT|nr:hypothetical protein [Oleomonas cavernae]RJF87644.1 hypothetical protein D3874_11945 [Oleomonas cavernae]
MQLIHPGPEEALLGLRAMRMVAQADGEIGPAAGAMIAAAQDFLLDLHVPLDELEPIAPAELAAGLSAPVAQQLVQGMIVVSLADGPASPAAWGRITEFAKALQVDLPALRTMQKMMEHHMLLFRLDFLRHSHIGGLLKDQYLHHGGIRGVAEAVLGLRGLHEDPALAARFTAFADLDAESLGGRFFRHYRDNSFGFPGEKFGFPLAGVYHDFSHVLGGYGVTPAEETLVAALMAGFRRQNPFYVILFAQLTFGAGLNVTPVKQPTVKSIMAEPGLAPRFFRAIERGGAMTTDLSDNWDFWPLVALPIDEVRARIGLAPE